jgi:hypothetical protein
MADTSRNDFTLLPDTRTSRRLAQIGAWALVATIGLLWHQSKVDDPLLLGVGSVMMVLGVLPALNWARKAEPHFPVFEMFMLTSVPFYAVPLMAGHPEVLEFPASATLEAAWTAIIFQACAIAAFTATRGEQTRLPWLIQPLVPERTLRYAQAGIWLNTAYLYINGFTTLIPYQLYVVFRAVFFGLGTISLFIEARRWGAGRSSAPEKLIVSLNVFLQLVFVFRDLYLISGISILLLAMIGYVSTSRRLPILLIVVALPLLAVLHNGKPAMRLEYWQAKKPLPELEALPAFFQEWFSRGLQPTIDEPGHSTTLTGRLFERASLFQMLCVVTERTPEVVPFLDGESYLYVPAQLIPTFLWPNKPSSQLSNILLAVHYRLVDPEEPGSVSIAFGMVAEAYANFGLLGAAGLGLLLGFGYKRVTVAAAGAPQFSALGLLTILLAAWSFQIEQIFATWFVSLLQAAFVVIGGALAFRTFFARE